MVQATKNFPLENSVLQDRTKSQTDPRHQNTTKTDETRFKLPQNPKLNMICKIKIFDNLTKNYEHIQDNQISPIKMEARA